MIRIDSYLFLNRRSRRSQSSFCTYKRLGRSLARVLCAFFVLLFPSSSVFCNDVVKAALEQDSAWTGEGVEMTITLYSPGPFSGTAAFELPELPKTAILKVGNPVVGSETVEGESVFTQRHEFLVFTQQTGVVTIPPFKIRFKGKKTFVGDAEPITGSTSKLSFESKQPPGTENLGVVVATSDFKATQEWIPSDKSDVFAGDVVQRTITRRVGGTTAMMLTPTDSRVPTGVRVYQQNPVVEDKTERGQLSATCIETIKYQFEQPGTFELPELTFTWWDAENNKLASKTLEGRSLNVNALAGGSANREESSVSSGTLNASRVIWALVIGFLTLLVYRPVRNFVDRTLELRNTPESIAAENVLAACRKNNAGDAYRHVLEWKTQTILSAQLISSMPEFVSAWNELEATLFASHSTDTHWSGRKLESAFTQLRSAAAKSTTEQFVKVLPELNP